MRKIWLISTAVIGSLSVAPVGVAVAVGAPPPGQLVAQSTAPQISPDDRILGKPDASITIFEYASLTCPHCAAFEKEILPQIKTDWIDTGKAKLIFRDFPLDASALKAAIVARCAPPERFYGFIDVLFTQQASWGMGGDPVPSLGRLAKLGGMGEEQFRACLKDDALQSKIVAGRLAAEKEFGVESTPTFFINGKKVVGARPEEIFEALKSSAPKA
jgi:protein-disulfide isomerase